MSREIELGALDLEEESARTFDVVLAPAAVEAFASIASRADMLKVDKMLQILDALPDISRHYDPVYDAARPPFSARAACAGHYGICSDVDEASLTVDVLFTEDQRRDLLGRFRGWSLGRGLVAVGAIRDRLRRVLGLR